ncbi:MAG: hypothetical protein R6X34_05800 [Chloroflexota bacterium]
MKNFKKWQTALAVKEKTWLEAIFLSSLLGTLTSGLVLRGGMEIFGGESFFVNLIISLMATAVYTLVVLSIFSLLFPETLPILKRKIKGK